MEILNSDDENQTVSYSSDCFPKERIEGVFVNETLRLKQGPIWCMDMFTTYTYPPGITEEYGGVSFYINQRWLIMLPDGNYTLWREMPGKDYRTIIEVESGEIKIIYKSFYYNRTEDAVTENNGKTNDTTDKTNISIQLSIISIIIVTYFYVLHKNKINHMYKRRK